MAAPKKKPAAKAKTTKAKGKSTPAKVDNPVEDVVAVLKGFQLHTLFALGLAVAFLLIQIIPDLRHLWWLNILFAAGAGYLFWRQEGIVSGLEHKICRWGLLVVVALFIWRDINISTELVDYVDKFGEWNKLFSK